MITPHFFHFFFTYFSLFFHYFFLAFFFFFFFFFAIAAAVTDIARATITSSSYTILMIISHADYRHFLRWLIITFRLLIFYIIFIFAFRHYDCLMLYATILMLAMLLLLILLFIFFSRLLSIYYRFPSSLSRFLSLHAISFSLPHHFSPLFFYTSSFHIIITSRCFATFHYLLSLLFRYFH